MYDYTLIKSEEFGKFSHLTKSSYYRERPRLFTEIDYMKYKLTNGKRGSEKAYMIIQVDNPWGKWELTIKGSLRKFYYGALSTKDLSAVDTLKALNIIADALDIPYADFETLKIGRLEIGYNFDIGSKDCATFINKIIGFKSGKYTPLIAPNYKLFRSGIMSGKVYDKIEEIKSHFGHANDKYQRSFLMKEGNRNILRVEFTLNKRPSIIEKNLGFNTVEGLVTDYGKAVKFFHDNCYCLKIDNNESLDFGDFPLTTKGLMDFALMKGLKSLGDLELDGYLSKMESRNRIDTRRRLKEVYGRMPHSSNYREFFLDLVRDQLILGHFVRSAQEKNLYIIDRAA